MNTWADDVSFNVSGPESSVTIRGIARLLEEARKWAANNREI